MPEPRGLIEPRRQVQALLRDWKILFFGLGVSLLLELNVGTVPAIGVWLVTIVIIGVRGTRWLRAQNEAAQPPPGPRRSE